MIYILLLLINSISANELFAGNGLRTYAHTILHNRILNMNCTTYDDCYELLCSYIFQPVAYITVKPNKWTGDCGMLNKTDDRLLDAGFEYGKNYHETKTISDVSLLLCNLSNVTEQIYYFIYNCSYTEPPPRFIRKDHKKSKFKHIL